MAVFLCGYGVTVSVMAGLYSQTVSIETKVEVDAT